MDDEIPELDVSFDSDTNDDNFDSLLEDLEDLEIGVSEILSNGAIPGNPAIINICEPNVSFDYETEITQSAKSFPQLILKMRW